MKVPVIKYLGRKYYNDIRWWLHDKTTIEVNYPDITADVIAQMMQEQVASAAIPVISIA